MQQKNFEVRVISLKNQEKRRESMQNLFRDNLTWSFVDAISGKDISHDIPFYDRKKRIRIFGYDMRVNELACFLSHKMAWEQCVALNKNMLILEDDVQIDRALSALDIIRIIDILAEGKDEIFVRLGNSARRNQKKKLSSIDERHSLYRYRKDPLGAFAYFLSPAIAQRLLLHSTKVFTPVDDFMWRGWEHGCLLMDVSNNLFITQEEGNPSSIGDRSKPEISFSLKICREWNRFWDVRDKMKYEKFCYDFFENKNG